MSRKVSDGIKSGLAALRDFEPADVAFGSFSTNSLGGRIAAMSGMPQKLTCAHSRRQLLANAAIAASRVAA
jgi:hypothetical protein